MLETGVPNLDLVLGGGLPESDVLLVAGPAGSGKTTLSLQIAFHTAARGRNVLYVSTLSEPATRLIKHLRGFSFCDESLIGKRLFLTSIHAVVGRGVHEIVDALVQAVKEQGASLAILDGLMAVHDLWPGVPELRTLLYEVGANLAPLGCTTVVTSSGLEPRGAANSPEFTMVDGIVELGLENVGTRTNRSLRAAKVRGQAPLLGLHSMRLDGDGVTVFPRLESVYSPVELGVSRERVPVGLPELDQMAGGGFLAGSVTLLAGAMGTGKSLLCLHYLMEGLRRGERALMVGFRETPGQLLDKARSFGLDLDAAFKSGQLGFLHRPQADLDVDQVAWEIRQAVERNTPSRLALDSVVELEQAILEVGRRRPYVSCLVGLLRNYGVTSLITREIAQVVGPELDFSDTPLALLSENLILLRYVEFRAELYRVLSILKMRDSDHDRLIRQYTITARGLQVLAPIESAEGMLTGIARSVAGAQGTRRARKREGGWARK